MATLALLFCFVSPKIPKEKSKNKSTSQCSKVTGTQLQHNNIRGVRLSGGGGVGVGPPFHPSVPVFVPSSVHPSKFFIPEEEDDGRVYSYVEIGVRVLMELFLIGWSPPLPTSIEGPSQGERMVGWST
jgi:hypothetical protein